LGAVPEVGLRTLSPRRSGATVRRDRSSSASPTARCEQRLRGALDISPAGSDRHRAPGQKEVDSTSTRNRFTLAAAILGLLIIGALTGLVLAKRGKRSTPRPDAQGSPADSAPTQSSPGQGSSTRRSSSPTPQPSRPSPPRPTGSYDPLGPGGPLGPDGPLGPKGPLGPNGPLGGKGRLPAPSDSQNLAPSGPLGPNGPLGPSGPLGPGH
jgi:hypothetical protein